MTENEIDTRVARALGLDVLGEAWCVQYPDDSQPYVSFGQSAEAGDWGGRREYVHLAHCICDLFAETIDEHRNVFGHFPGCLEVVPDYLHDIAAAMQVWDALPWPDCYTSLRSTAVGGWRFDVVYEHKEAVGIGDTRQKAICKGFLVAKEREVMT